MPFELSAEEWSASTAISAGVAGVPGPTGSGGMEPAGWLKAPRDRAYKLSHCTWPRLPSSDLRRCAPVGTTTLETPAWLMRGVITYNAKLGTLRLTHGRLGFRETGVDVAMFDIPLAEIGNVKFRFYSLGSVVRFDAGGKRYRLAFLPSERRFKWSGARIRDVRPARRWGKQWKAVLLEGRSQVFNSKLSIRKR